MFKIYSFSKCLDYTTGDNIENSKKEYSVIFLQTSMNLNTKNIHQFNL